MTENFMLSSRGLLEAGRVHTLVTSSFSHNNFLHLAFNMATLMSFSRPVIQRLGAAGFVRLYLSAAILSSAGFVAYDVLMKPLVPARFRLGDDLQCLGASGAVASVLTYGIMS